MSKKSKLVQTLKELIRKMRYKRSKEYIYN